MNSETKQTTKRRLDTTAQKILLLVAIMLVFTVVMTIARPRFLSAANLLNILKDIAVMGTLAMGMTFVLITGGIDLSAGYNVTLGTVVAGVVFMATDSAWLAILAAVCMTTFIGLLNGLIITKLRITPFIATLATMSAAQGLIQYLGSGKLLKLSAPVFAFVGKQSLLGIPVSAILMLLVLLIGGLVLRNTRLGSYTYAIGCSEKHAKSAGINIHRCLIIIYCIEGLCAGIASILLGSKVSLVTLNAGGSSTLMDTIAAVVLGGVSTAGGEGRMSGTLLGVIFMGFISNSLTLLNVPAVAQDLFKGIVIILAIVLNSATSQIKLRRAAPAAQS